MPKVISRRNSVARSRTSKSRTREAKHPGRSDSKPARPKDWWKMNEPGVDRHRVPVRVGMIIDAMDAPDQVCVVECLRGTCYIGRLISATEKAEATPDRFVCGDINEAVVVYDPQDSLPVSPTAAAAVALAARCEVLADEVGFAASNIVGTDPDHISLKECEAQLENCATAMMALARKHLVSADVATRDLSRAIRNDDSR